ncbi:vacuole morphology and inheritance protein 14 [Fistulifera solaris]|uniref:Vacuole morphology and inheritance protein 14 n=1 Tax=Fistulifera solaris TaxID=1519565 RepID=A0A1Z5KHV5_FISSO|nr:vacuole morphology and inheritance protein 14 [Fistulifera solaris]|eukprot:GAX25894.1 vacuole morphology and inheritance protein 14 [Fistulifera solaris]
MSRIGSINSEERINNNNTRNNNAPPPRPTRTRRPTNESRLHQPHGAAAFVTNQMIPSQQPQQALLQLSLESPLPPLLQRGLGDRSNEKRKNAAMELEALIQTLPEHSTLIDTILQILAKDFCTSMNSNYRKGGLMGLAATAIGLLQRASQYLPQLLPPVLHCLDDPEARVRYYACESLYNIAKVSRSAILLHDFPALFAGLTQLYADVDVDVKNGAHLLDRLIKDIVIEAEHFSIDLFLPILQNYIKRTNPYIRQLMVGWITLLDSLPDISMLTYLREFLDGLFHMLSDSNLEIRQAADAALSEFLRELSVSTVVELGPLIAILGHQCQSKERLNRLTAITWMAELIHHPYSGGDALLPFHGTILQAILWCISDHEKEIRLVAERANDDLLALGMFELPPLLDTLTKELLEKEDVPTKMASLRWINMLMEKRKLDMDQFVESILPVLLRTLSDPSDAVILLDLQVFSRISLAHRPHLGKRETEEAQFQLVLNAILDLFAQDKQLLETRGSLIIRKLCVLLNAKTVYIRMAETLASYEKLEGQDETQVETTLQFTGTMVQTLNLILLTASELHDLRSSLARSFEKGNVDAESANVFATLFRCWCHNPVATFSLCLLARAYDLSFALVKRFSLMEDVTVGFLMQLDKLVFLLESPIFVHLRIQLLDVEAPYHAPLLKSIYGILMCLPQGDAFRLLNERLTAVCNLRENLGLRPVTDDLPLPSIVAGKGLDMENLLQRYDHVTEQQRTALSKGRAFRQLPQTTSEIVVQNNSNRPVRSVPPLFSSPSNNNVALPSQLSNGGGGSGNLTTTTNPLTRLNNGRRPNDAGSSTRITVHRSFR